MAATLGKNLHLCFTKIKNRPLQPESESPNSSLLPLYSAADSPPRQLSDSPDFATVCASSRFFFSSPGRSNSIVDSAESSDSPTSHKCNPPLSDQSSTSESWDSHKVRDTVAVPTYSPDPYLDFRRSMEEMVAARGAVDVKANWDYLHELLLCYLALNPKSTHRFVVRAFADLLVSLLATAPPSTAESMEE